MNRINHIANPQSRAKASFLNVIANSRPARSVRVSRRVQPLALSLLALSLLGGSAARVRANETTIKAAAGPTVVDWPNNHLAMFTITGFYGTYDDGSDGGGSVANCITAYVGSLPDTAPTSPNSANWQQQLTINMGHELKDRLQVVPQPCNKTLIFANENNQKIWCYTVKHNDDGSQIQNQGDNIEPITVNGGFDSYCIIPLPFKTPAPFLNDPTLDQELYPMLLVYVQNSVVHCERLDFAWSNAKNKWVLNRSQRNFGQLFSVNSAEKKVSACLTPSRDPDTAADFPYSLIVTTIMPTNSSQSKGYIRARKVRLDGDGYQDTSVISAPIQAVGGFDGRSVWPAQDLIAYVGADGRPAVNCMDGDNHPIHYVCDQSQPFGQQWQWDTSYGGWWDSNQYRWTPTTNYYTSWKATDQTVNTVSLPGVAASNKAEDVTGPYANDHEIVRPVFRYALGERNSVHYMSGMREPIFNAHLTPVKFIPSSQMKSVLIGIIEGPPPVPWQNVQISLLSQGSTWGSTIVNLATTTEKNMDTQTSTELIAKTAGGVGVAWDISATSTFQQFGSTSAQKVSTQQYGCDLKINAPADPKAPISIPKDIAKLGTAILLQQDCELYDWSVTWTDNSPISGSTPYQQVALKNPSLVAVSYTMSRRHGIVQDPGVAYTQGLYAGCLSSYFRASSNLLDSYPLYSPDQGAGDSLDAITYSWANNSSGDGTKTVSYSSTKGMGTSFSLQALTGIGSSDASAMVGFQASGSWVCATTNTQTATLQSYAASNLAYSTAPGIYGGYAYKTYWLQGSNAWLQSFQNVLADFPDDSYNKYLIQNVAPTSAPWVVTYGLYGTPVWNGGDWNLAAARAKDKM